MNCDVLCISANSFFASSGASDEVDEVLDERCEPSTTPKCTNNPATRDVMRAAELPSPVLCTFPRVVWVELKGGREERDASVDGRERLSS